MEAEIISYFRFMLFKISDRIKANGIHILVYPNNVYFRFQLSDSVEKLVTPRNVDFQLLHQYPKVLE